MAESRRRTFQKVLQIGVIFSAVGVWSSHWMKSNSESVGTQIDLSQDSFVQRNERSVPRSFILPASPGVAFEQEAQRANAARQIQITNCVGALKVLGYDPGDATFLNAKLVEAVYTYQVTHKLPATGRLDPSTMGMLKCT